MTTTTTKRITIALSDEAPVSVCPDDWPIIAEASDWHGGAVECQANELWWIKVRQHRDGRRIIYGQRDSGPGGVPLDWRGAHAGYLLAGDAPAGETVRAIRRVAGVLGDDGMADQVIADLPARELNGGAP